MPLSRSVSKNIRELKAAHPDWSHKRIVAASLNAARSADNKKVVRRRKK